MKKINYYFIFTIICLNVFSCVVGDYWNTVDVNLTFNPSKPTPGTDVTVKCSNYDFFNPKTAAFYSEDNFDENEFYKKCFNVCQNVFSNDTCLYNLATNAATLKEKKSNKEAVYTLPSNVVSCFIQQGLYRSSTADGCDKSKYLFDNLMINPKFLYINYPQELTLDKTSAKVGDKVTITSSKPFFDEATFSKEKAKILMIVGYNIVWYSIKNIEKDFFSNIEKMPVPKENIDFDTLTPTSVTFTVPSDAITGTIHVINEGGFVCDPTNDLNLVGNVAGANAYYASEVLTITK